MARTPDDQHSQSFDEMTRARLPVPKYSFDKKDKLPKGMAYPLGRDALDTALANADISKLHCVYFARGTNQNSTVLWASYCGECHKGWAGAGLTSIWVYAVPSDQRRSIEQAIVTDMLPKMLSWLGELELASNVYRGNDQNFWAAWFDGKVSIEASKLH